MLGFSEEGLCPGVLVGVAADLLSSGVASGSTRICLSG
jgi:hypothetical protein